MEIPNQYVLKRNENGEFVVELLKDFGLPKYNYSISLCDYKKNCTTKIGVIKIIRSELTTHKQLSLEKVVILLDKFIYLFLYSF